MKLYATYGLTMALAGALFTLILFFAGMHGEHYDTGKALGALAFLIPIIGTPLGIRAWRNQAGNGVMTYGRGLAVGCLISVWRGLGEAVFTLLYGLVINPGFSETILQKEIAKLESRNLPANAVEMAEKVMRITTHPGFLAPMALLGACFIGLIIALIAAAMLKREAPPVVAQPPPLT